jgi:transcription-repair coupling factor (superfamily II helicase)
MANALKFTQELTERKTRMDWVRHFMRQLEENAIADLLPR